MSLSPQKMSIDDKVCPVAVVVGITGGIGSRIANTLVQDGYSVVGLGRSREKLSSCKGVLSLAASGWSAFMPPPHPFLEMYVANNFAEIHWAIKQTIENLGKIDLLVFAHGASAKPTPFESITLSEYRRVLDTDIWHTVQVCQKVIPHMVSQQSGSIVFLTSFHVRGTYPQRTVYNIAKHGIVALTESLCCEYAKAGINVNCIAPGQVEGERSDRFVSEEMSRSGQNIKAYWAMRSPAGEIVDPDDIANTVLCLAQTKSINGQTITIDHGVTASNWYKDH